MDNPESKYFSNERPQSFTYTIGGVKIEMPVKPYPSQVSMMDKVIRGCQKQQNCLLESPTGSGKTLALLCSALSWQRSEKERLEKIFQKEEEEFIKNNKTPAEIKPLQAPVINTETNVSLSKKKGWSSPGIVISEDDSEEEMSIFKQPGKRRKINTSQISDVSANTKEKSNNDSIMTNDSSANNSLITDDEDENYESQIDDRKPKKPKLVVPVIYFCTRTHKQIEQVVKELQRTCFNDVVKSCVLASREHTCIQDSDIHFPNISYKSKTELCRSLLDPKARMRNSLKYKRSFDKCNFYDNGGVKISTYGQLSHYGVSSVWDIEDIIGLGRKRKSCPYFGSRLLLKTADIVFCPYNYIIDPVIRGTMKMKLQGHVIIVDEAHNIEDTCRDAASLQLDQTNLNLAKHDCENLSNTGNNSTTYAALAKYLADLSKWIDQKSDSIKTYDDYNRGVISWSGTYTIASFNENDVGLKEFTKFKKNCEIIMADLDDEAEIDEKENDQKTLNQNDTDGKEIGQNEFNEGKTECNELKSKNKLLSQEDDLITNATKTMLTGICTVFGLFFDDVYKNDYHVSLEKVMQVKNYENGERATADLDGWINCAEPKDSRAVWNNTLSFLCLNPAAVFQELKATARSIILTSGTLSPMQSFQSELGTSFPITLEANHVIKQNQCWVTSVSHGPTQIDLNSQYQNANTYGYQDEMGRALKNICEIVPYGVLCFVPSYLLMEKLYNRWRVTGLLKELNRIKVVLCEPRKGNELEKLMGKYYMAIKKASNAGKSTSQLSGALFLAVYRGKISEGLDFSDNNARAVVAIGIPFPNFKDVAVTHKKEYNDKHHKNKGLLPGWEWYQIQAYRALNQALGRCIRHRNDWGAILLIDSRYGQSKNIAGLSKWIRGKVEHNSNWSTIITKLNDFIELRQQKDANHIV